MLRPEQILEAKFTPVSKGTYNAEEVDAYLKKVAASYEESLNNNQELIKKISILADKIESYRNDEEAIKLALLDAHKMADNVNKAANDKAESLVADAENKSKIILDGANRQAAQTIDEAREKAKEIVDNARAAVASLTEKAQAETDSAIADAKKKAAEIVADAEAKGKEIIGSSKQAYEFYSAELEKLNEETSKFKVAVENICNGQLNLLNEIPGKFVPAEIPANIVDKKAEEVVAEEPAVEEAPQENVLDGQYESAINELYDDIDANAPVEDVQEEEHDESAIALMQEINGLADEVFVGVDNSIPEASVEEFEKFEVTPDFDDNDDDVDDLFDMIEDVEFDGASVADSFAASLDDFVPSIPEVQEEEEVSFEADVEADDDDVAEEIEEDDDDDDFEGFQIDLDSVTDDSDDDDEDITSLFDSLFDD